MVDFAANQTIEISALRGAVTTGWREDMYGDWPITSPDGQYEIIHDGQRFGFLQRKGDRESFPPIPLPFPDLHRAEWSPDGRQLILISGWGREQHWAWPPPRKWEPSLEAWLANFEEHKPEDREPHLSEAQSAATPQVSVEPAPWLDALRNVKLTDPAWQELQKWWLDGRRGPRPKPAPALPTKH
jgi:hypothetical protein